jgi:hypothetical protein
MDLTAAARACRAEFSQRPAVLAAAVAGLAVAVAALLVMVGPGRAPVAAATAAGARHGAVAPRIAVRVTAPVLIPVLSEKPARKLGSRRGPVDADVVGVDELRLRRLPIGRPDTAVAVLVAVLVAGGWTAARSARRLPRRRGGRRLRTGPGSTPLPGRAPPHLRAT